jgi:hypothetical protein
MPDIAQSSEKKMALGGVKPICNLYVDGKEFFQSFGRDGVETMKQRLVGIGIEERRILITERMPNL